MMRCKDLTSIEDLSLDEIEEIFNTTNLFKSSPVKEHSQCLSGKILGMIFEKSSMRTRVSFEVAMTLLGGHAIYLTQQDIYLGKRESIKDGAKALSRYVDCIAVRTYAHETVLELAKYATVPVINALSDYSHPCQALADLYTIKEKRGGFEGLILTFIGDGNNVARSLALLCAKLGVTFKIASPQKYELSHDFIDAVNGIARQGGRVSLYNDPRVAAKDADVIYTDIWVSMGQESEADVRKIAFKEYQVDNKLVSLAKKDALVMHCLPAHRGEEITDEVIDGPNSIVYDQAENRMHVEKALLKLFIRR